MTASEGDGFVKGPICWRCGAVTNLLHGPASDDVVQLRTDLLRVSAERDLAHAMLEEAARSIFRVASAVTVTRPSGRGVASISWHAALVDLHSRLTSFLLASLRR